MEDRWYVYIYLDQRINGCWKFNNKIINNKPFYVGKGTNNRDIIHLYPFMLNKKSYKSSKIKSIIKDTGEQPIHYRLFENLSEVDAIKLEIDFIKKFGRRDNNTGILCNHTDGGDGANNFSYETLKKLGANKKIIYQYDLDGDFIKKWNSITNVGDELNINTTNISTAIKRNGTSSNYIWSYEFLGDKINNKKKYQMPVKYSNIKQYNKKTNKYIKTYKNALEAETKLNLRKGARNKIIECINGSLNTAYGYKWKI